MIAGRKNRSSGILLHPTSLPSPYGVGDIGPTSFEWIDQLARAKQKWWQILPLGPTGYGDSPYQCFSAFAGNPYLISPDLLVRDGLIRQHDLAGHEFPVEKVDYGAVIPFKMNLLRIAWENFRAGQATILKDPFDQFCSQRATWLNDYALFMALKDARRGQSWLTWPHELFRREGNNKVIDFAKQELVDDIGFYQFIQFLFFKQWHQLREYAASKGISLIGDIPIFVSADSADVWANPKFFLLDGSMKPRVVAGVPPDYFSPTGQLWGNPLYDWDAMRETGFTWWVERMKATLELVDLVRLDHFRGFCAAWHIPANELTAEKGEWVPGPAKELFDVLIARLGTLPIIAEDLGEITPDVYQLRDDYNLPGMKILQFAFDKPNNPFLPHNFSQNCVVYTGTHDNDTTRGWYDTLEEWYRKFMHQYLDIEAKSVSWQLIRFGWSSVADYAIAPMQDLLTLDTTARMNFPGKPAGNWKWRLLPGQFTKEIMERIADWTELFNRIPTND